MLRNSIKDFQEKVNNLDRFNLYTQKFLRGNKPHYTETLNIDEGVIYSFGNEYSRSLLKRIIRSSAISVMVFARPVNYEESTNTHTYEAPEWITIDCYSIGDGEYPHENFDGLNEDGEKRSTYLDDVTHFMILPTQKPKQAKSYEPWKA